MNYGGYFCQNLLKIALVAIKSILTPGSGVIIVITVVSSAAMLAKRAGFMFVMLEAYKTCYPGPHSIITFCALDFWLPYNIALELDNPFGMKTK